MPAAAVALLRPPQVAAGICDGFNCLTLGIDDPNACDSRKPKGSGGSGGGALAW